MSDFDSILTNLHKYNSPTTLIDKDTLNPIVITSRRSFEVPSDYNTILGYTGDVNSQIVTFQLPKLHEAHSLYDCQFKKIKWQNLKSGTEGVSDLITQKEDTDTWTAIWEVPPELMTMAGEIEIAVSIYDEKDGFIAFSWNTPAFRGFSVGASANQVADVWSEGNKNLPAANEILVVNTENRRIEAPVNWNPIICSYGDIGLSKVFFEINQYIRGLDLTDEQVEIYIGVAFANNTVENFPINKNNIQKMFVSTSNVKANKILITWDVPAVITNNAQGYSGDFTISLKIQIADGEVITKRWTTAKFNKLTIGPSALQDDIIALITRDEEILERAVTEVAAEITNEIVDEKIDDYFDNTYFITEDN